MTPALTCRARPARRRTQARRRSGGRPAHPAAGARALCPVRSPRRRGAGIPDDRRCRNAFRRRCRTASGRAAPCCASAARRARGWPRARSRPSSPRSRGRCRCGQRRDRAESGICWWRPRRRDSDSWRRCRGPAAGSRSAPPRAPMRSDRRNRRRHRPRRRSRCQ